MNRFPHISAGLAAICGLAFVIYLALYDPTVAPAPRCWFNALTGLQCPGCGSQRAMHALLHGHICEAWHYNAAMFFALPLCVIYAVPPRRLHSFLYSPITICAIAAAIAAWFIIRNI
ncbi:MAG: DUF2752 domain-containing protein [Muribaculaceae bacterium]|nr:DUF2752 domain-containing protein [Muribaculaceae bacterium]